MILEENSLSPRIKTRGCPWHADQVRHCILSTPIRSTTAIRMISNALHGNPVQPFQASTFQRSPLRYSQDTTRQAAPSSDSQLLFSLSRRFLPLSRFCIPLQPYLPASLRSTPLRQRLPDPNTQCLYGPTRPIHLPSYTLQPDRSFPS